MQVTSVCGALGAEIEDIDLSKPLSNETADAVMQAFADHLVLVFRGQNIDPHAHVAFTELFGQVEAHPLRPRRHLEEEPGVMVLENFPGNPGPRNDFWHSDLSHMPEPPSATCLYAIDIPVGRGDTMYCNTYLAYETLSEAMRNMLDGLKAVHSGEATQRRNSKDGTGLAVGAVPPPHTHPVARAHPVTGRKALYINPFFTTHFEDMSPEESKPLLDFLYEHAARPEHIYRHRWAPQDLVIWDNRCTMHYAVKDYDENQRRYLHRTTAAGDRPI